MTIEAAIEAIEAMYTCELGAPWRWADLEMMKPYTSVTYYGQTAGSEMFKYFRAVKAAGGYREEQRPKLYWRYLQKLRVVDNEGVGGITARFYVDGNPQRQPQGNPGHPSGTPGAGTMRIADADQQIAVAA